MNQVFQNDGLSMMLKHLTLRNVSQIGRLRDATTMLHEKLW